MGSPDGEDFTDSDSDEDFKEDMEALRKACQIVVTNPVDSNKPSTTARASATSDDDGVDEEDDEGDLEMLRSIQKRFTLGMGESDELLMRKPLCTLPPGLSDSDADDDCEEDYETLRAIKRRFAAYNEGGVNNNLEDISCRLLQVDAIVNDSEMETSNRFVERTDAREGFPNHVDMAELSCLGSAGDGRAGPSDLLEWNKPVRDNISGPPVGDSQFPKSAMGFVDAIKKNRSCQKFIRNKMLQVGARIEELKKLIERVKILRDFQVACRKRIGRTLTQKRDARVQLISVQKPKTNAKGNEEKIRALSKGPPENVHVAKYRQAMAIYPVSVTRDKWSKEERENLLKGVKQQFQGMVLQHSVDHISEAEGSCEPDNVDSVMVLIKDLNITPEKMRLFLPKVNWEQLAAMYVPQRSGAECQAMFLNFEDPLINHNPWTKEEDKNLLHIVQDQGLRNWMDIAASMGGNRTPFQCLVRYQRSLNSVMIKREWSTEEDYQLRAAVETYGESNWQTVASVMEGRAGTQCSNRWIKSIHPEKKRVGRWTPEEDKRLKVAVTLFGPKWKEVASYVPGRTHPQCRERWVNSLDPSLNMSRWTKEEDLKLEAAVAELGYCWSKVAARIPHRTDNQCWRRWKVLFPNEVPLIQAARKIRKAAFISNFVDRESEKPSLGPDDFLVPEIYRITGPENAEGSERKSRKLSDNASPSKINSEEVSRSTNGSKGKRKSSRSTKKDTDLTMSQDGMSCDNGKDASKPTTTRNTSKRKPHQLKRKSSVELESPDRSLMLVEACGEGINNREPCPEDGQHSGLQVENVWVGESAELECNNANKALKACKLNPKRKKILKTSHNNPEALHGMEMHEIEKEAVVGNEKDKQIDASSGLRSSVPSAGNLPTETTRGDGGTSEFVGDQLSCLVGTVHEQHQVSSNSNAYRALSGNLEDSVLSTEKDNEIHLSENPTSLSEELEDDAALASFMKKAMGRKKRSSII